MRGFVFDAGAFIGLERRAPLMLGIFDEALRGRVEVILPRTVIAQVWRGTPRQANVGRLISAGLGRGSPVVIDELTPERARQIGVTIGQTSHPDIVDVHVALVAAERGHAVLTSDDADIAHIGGPIWAPRSSSPRITWRKRTSCATGCSSSTTG